MRDEIDMLLKQMADRSCKDATWGTSTTRQTPNWAASLRALLHVAAGWFYFGRDRQAEPILQAARSLLYRDELA